MLAIGLIIATDKDELRQDLPNLMETTFQIKLPRTVEMVTVSDADNSGLNQSQITRVIACDTIVILVDKNLNYPIETVIEQLRSANFPRTVFASRFYAASDVVELSSTMFEKVVAELQLQSARLGLPS